MITPPAVLEHLAGLFANRRFVDSTGYFLRSELRRMLRNGKLVIPQGAVVLEIGTFEGLASIFFAKTFASEVYTVDPFEPSDPGTPVSVSTEENCRINLRRSRYSQSIKLFKSTSDEFFSRFPRPDFDFIYIDGSHDPQVLARDLTNSLRRLKRQGVLWIDDYGSDYRVNGSSVKNAVDSFYARSRDQLDTLHLGYQAGFQRL